MVKYVEVSVKKKKMEKNKLLQVDATWKKSFFYDVI